MVNLKREVAFSLCQVYKIFTSIAQTGGHLRAVMWKNTILKERKEAWNKLYIPHVSLNTVTENQINVICIYS